MSGGSCQKGCCLAVTRGVEVQEDGRAPSLLARCPPPVPSSQRITQDDFSSECMNYPLMRY